MYGLTDASRLWYIRVREELAKLNVSKSKFDDAIFYYHKNNNLEGIISTHVDDVFWGGTQAFQENVIGFLKNIFRTSKENQHSFVYLGLTMKQNECDIELNQDNYISEMSLVEIQNEQSRSPDDALNEDERKQLRTVIGQLNWVVNQTRPDIAYEACQASISFKDARVKDVKKVNKVIRKLKNDRVILKFVDLGDLKQCNVLCFSDASYRNLPDEGSQGAISYFFVINKI